MLVLEVEVNKLHAMVDTLVKRLPDVLRDPFPEDVKEKQKGDVLAPLAQRIAEWSKGVQQACGRLADVVQRLEI